MQETARRRQAPPHLRSSPTSNQVCGAFLQEENSGQPVAFIECLGGRMCVILHYCPPPTKLWNKAGKTTSKIYPNGPFESLWTVSFLCHRWKISSYDNGGCIGLFCNRISSLQTQNVIWVKWNHHNIFPSVLWNEANRRLVSESFSRLASQPSQDPNGAPTCHHPLHSTTNCICRTTNLL